MSILETCVAMVIDRGYTPPPNPCFPFSAKRGDDVIRVQRSVSLSADEVRALVPFMEQQGIGVYIAVTDRAWSSKAAVLVPPHLRIENFTEEELTPNPARTLPITHRIVAAEWSDKMPVLLASDIMARYLGCKEGDVVEIAWGEEVVMLRRVAHS